MLIQARLDRITLKELLRLVEAKEQRSRQVPDPVSADRWYETAEWLRELLSR